MIGRTWPRRRCDAPADPACPGGGGAAGQLRVLDAVYGNPERGRMCDATAPLAHECDGRSDCVIEAGNGICGDPDFGTRKRLFVTFKCGGLPAQTVTVLEATAVRLRCQPGTPPGPGENTGFQPPAAR